MFGFIETIKATRVKDKEYTDKLKLLCAHIDLLERKLHEAERTIEVMETLTGYKKEDAE